MKLVTLTKGQHARVDDVDYPFVMQWKWYAQVSDTGFYAARRQRLADGKSILIYMHRALNKTPDGLKTDHRDGDGLNNTRDNLRDATSLQNLMNRAPRRRSPSGHKGVWRDAAPGAKKQWRAGIRLNGKPRYLGRFVTEAEGAAAYAKAAAELFGEYSSTMRGTAP